MSRWLGILVGTLLAVGLVLTARPAPATAVNPVGVACGVPGVSAVCDAIGDQASAAAGALADGVFGQLKDAVVDAAVWGVTKVVASVDATTRVDLSGGYITDHYRFMTAAGGLFVLPFLLLVVAQGVLRGDGGLILRAVFGQLPAAVLLTVIAITVMQGLLAVTDGLADALLSPKAGLTVGVKDSLPDALGATAIPVLLAVVVGFVLMAAAVVVWLELLVRSAAIQIAVVFLPLFLAGLVWPATARYARRLAEILGALVFSKLVVVAMLSLALGALSDGSINGVLAGTAMFLLAAFAPFIVLALIPIATDAGQLSQSRRHATSSSRAAQAGGSVVMRAAKDGGMPGGAAGATRSPGSPTPGGLPIAGRARKESS